MPNSCNLTKGAVTRYHMALTYVRICLYASILICTVGYVWYKSFTFQRRWHTYLLDVQNCLAYASV